jgi:hypothetical protein
MRKALLGLLIGLVLLGAGCASPPRSRGSNPRSVTVTLRDNGRTLSLRPGDELIVTLTEVRAGGAPPAEGPVWILREYPKTQLRLNSDPRNGRFEFVAVAVGSGHLLATEVTDPCGKSLRCPLGASGQVVSRLLEFEVTVRVS